MNPYIVNQSARSIKKPADAAVIIMLLILSIACIACGSVELPAEKSEEDSSPVVQGAPPEKETKSADTWDTSDPIFAGSPSPKLTESLCPTAGQINFITDLEVHQTPQLTEPMPRLPFRDPIFGTCLVRVTDRRSDLSDDDISEGLKNEYSRVLSFNADGSLIVVRGIEATWYVYDSQTFQPLTQIPIGEEPRWDSRDPNVLYYSEEAHLMAFNVRSGEHTLIHDFSNDFPNHSLAAVWTRYEGSPSLDRRFWGFMAQDTDWETFALLVYDKEIDQVIATLNVRGAPDLDSVTISPLGNYFLAYFDYCESGLGDASHPCGLMVYDRDLQEARGLLRVIGHSDLALDKDRAEVLVYQDIDTDHISVLDLESGSVTPLWSIDFSHTPIGFHFSGHAYQLPGWALVSTYDGDPTAYTWMDDQVFVVELTPGGRIVRLAHTHSLVDEDQEQDYWAEPHASVSQDFTRILFTSNWGRSGTGQVDMYLIELPQDWIEELPDT